VWGQGAIAAATERWQTAVLMPLLAVAAASMLLAVAPVAPAPGVAAVSCCSGICCRCCFCCAGSGVLRPLVRTQQRQ
jgi:hypothetical protein